MVLKEGDKLWTRGQVNITTNSETIIQGHVEDINAVNDLRTSARKGEL